MSTNGLDHKVLYVAGEQKCVISEQLAKRLAGPYIRVEKANTLEEYVEQRQRSPKPGVVFFDFDYPLFEDPVQELMRLRNAGASTIGLGRHLSAQGLTYNLQKSGLLVHRFVKPPEATLQDDKLSFYSALAHEAESRLLALTRLKDTIAFCGTGHTNKNLACLAAELPEIKRILLYNGGKEEHNQAKAEQTALAVRTKATHRNDLSVHLVPQSAIRYNAALAIVAIGNIEFEIEEFDRCNERREPIDVAFARFFERYALDIIKLYAELGPRCKKIHVTNPVEPLTLLGSIASDPLFMKTRKAGKVEGFVTNDDHRRLGLLQEWWNEYSQATEGSYLHGVPAFFPNLVQTGLHLQEGSILHVDVNGHSLEHLRQTTRNEKISRTTLLQAPRTRGPAKAREAKEAYVINETAGGLLKVIQDTLHDRPSYAAIRTDPTEFRIFREGKITINGKSMKRREFFNTEFPYGVVLDVPAERIDGRIFPNSAVLRSAAPPPQIELNALCSDLLTSKKYIVRFAKKHQKELQLLENVLEFFNAQ